MVKSIPLFLPVLLSFFLLLDSSDATKPSTQAFERNGRNLTTISANVTRSTLPAYISSTPTHTTSTQPETFTTHQNENTTPTQDYFWLSQTAMSPVITPSPRNCTVNHTLLGESKLTMVCSRDALPTCSPQHVIPSGATLRLACRNSTSVSTVGADLYGMDRMHCDNGQWQPADFPVCFDRCLIDHQKLNFSGLNISDGQLTGGNTLRSGYSFTVECKDLDATLMGLGTLYCLDGELVPSTLPICIPHDAPDGMRPTPTDENSQSAGDTVSTTTFIAVVVPISVVTSLLCVILLVFWRRTLLQSGQLPNNRHDSREVMIVNNTFSPDHLTSTPTPPDVPRRPAKESYFSSVESSAYYVAPAPTGKAQATGNKASSIYEYIEPKHTDYYLELVA